MQKQTALKLVRETLQGSFDKERFVYLVKNILNHIEEAPFTYKGNFIFDDFVDSIRLVERVGKYQSSDEKLVDILIVHLAKDTSLDRARTKQRNFVAKYLKGSRGGALKDAALVAFVAPNGEDWRFSLVKMEYKFNLPAPGEARQAGEKIKVEEEFTPARRYSFLVGKNENSHTAQSRLLPVLLNDDVNPTLEELEETFSVERVTKEFFEKYRDLFLRLKESLDGIVKKDAKVRADFKKKNVDTADFAKKLLGQIVFLYFLQKKGWFGVPRGKKWGDGDKHFLSNLFLRAQRENKNYFNEYLEPLFYQALRYDRGADDDYFSQFDCKIPFLNGGLFDPMNDYDWVNTDIILPNDLFSNSQKTKEGDTGDGVLDIFDRYNFTVKEDEPLEKEVAVDPEMLGKVFENLLEVKDRKSKGTYYTPREIVHYMCQESLANYLATELDDKVSKEDIETLIKYGETVVEHDSRVVDAGRETARYSFKLPQIVRKHAKLIDEKLAAIRVCDPAVGSGAFPVGMMNEIIRTRNALTPYIQGSTGIPACENTQTRMSVPRSSYHFKRQAIQNCLYGVDIDPGAVEIAKLRLWLSLVVDEEERETIQPLPNLDYKIVQGNSLLSVEKNLFNQQLFNELERLKPLYFNETSTSKKQKYRRQIDDLISQITNGHKDFDFEVYFSEVFHDLPAPQGTTRQAGKKGFDVVIANPPYVRVDDLEKSLKDQYKKNYKTAIGKYDLCYLFFEKSFRIVNPQGVSVFISPNKFCAADSASALRETLFNTINAGEIISTSRIKVFSEASNYPIISILSKANISKDFCVRQVEKLTQLESKHSGVKRYTADRTDFELLPNQVIPINISQSTLDLLKRLYTKGQAMAEYVSVSEGLRIPSKLESETSGDLKIVKQFQFSKYSRIKEGSFLSKSDFAKIISSKSDRYNKILSPKILIAEDALQISATLDLDRLIPQGGVYFATSTNNEFSIKFLLGLLNSLLLSHLYESLYAGMHMGGGYLRYRSKFLESLPMPAQIKSRDMEKIELMVNKILAIAKDLPAPQTASPACAQHADRRQAGDLTAEEIKIVESQVN